MIVNTPKPPYYAVIFTSKMSENTSEYDVMSDLMLSLATKQDGFIGIESARNELGVTVSYWKDLESIKTWKAQSDHKNAQQKGKQIWYKNYKVRISKVEYDYGFEK